MSLKLWRVITTAARGGSTRRTAGDRRGVGGWGCAPPRDRDRRTCRLTSRTADADQTLSVARRTDELSVPTEGRHTTTSCPASRSRPSSSSTTRFSPDAEPDRYCECSNSTLIAARSSSRRNARCSRTRSSRAGGPVGPSRGRCGARPRRSRGAAALRRSSPPRPAASRPEYAASGRASPSVRPAFSRMIRRRSRIFRAAISSSEKPVPRAPTIAPIAIGRIRDRTP